jgi:hypothetical protein
VAEEEEATVEPIAAAAKAEEMLAAEAVDQAGALPTQAARQRAVDGSRAVGAFGDPAWIPVGRLVRQSVRHRSRVPQ